MSNHGRILLAETENYTVHWANAFLTDQQRVSASLHQSVQMGNDCYMKQAGIANPEMQEDLGIYPVTSVNIFIGTKQATECVPLLEKTPLL